MVSVLEDLPTVLSLAAELVLVADLVLAVLVALRTELAEE